MNVPIEVRAAVEFRATSPSRLEGYAATFDSTSRDLGGFVEIVRPSAFTRSLASPDEIRALYDHRRDAVLGRVGSHTLRLKTDARGLAFSLELPNTQLGHDVGELVKRGDLNSCSFAFTVPRGGDKWTFGGPIAKRELLDVDLHEISVCGGPGAYSDTSVAARALAAFTERETSPLALAMARRYLATMRG